MTKAIVADHSGNRIVLLDHLLAYIPVNWDGKKASEVLKKHAFRFEVVSYHDEDEKNWAYESIDLYMPDMNSFFKLVNVMKKEFCASCATLGNRIIDYRFEKFVPEDNLFAEV